MFTRLFHFLKGYVIIEVTGSDLVRFFNICVRRNIGICNAEHTSDGRVLLYVRASDFPQLRPIAFKTKTRVRIVQKSRLYNIRRNYKKLYGFLAGIVFFVLFFAITSQYIWVVQISGVYFSDHEKIAQILAEDGIYTGAKKSKIKDKTIIKQSLINGTDTISWAWVYFEGAKARVEIYEKNLPSLALLPDEPCNIVAARDGFLEEVTTIRGDNLIKGGTAVLQGDVIISGKVPVFKEYDEEERYIFVPAHGSARARCVHKISGVYSLNQKREVPTGKREGFLCFELFGKAFYLFGKDTPSFENYKTTYSRHELTLPFVGFTGISINTKKCEEVEVKTQILTYDTAVDIAKNDLEEKIAKELLPRAKLINSEIECKTINKSDIEVTLTMTVSEDIGIKQPIQEE